MLSTELILKNPLRFMADKSEDLLPDGGLGVVMARAGVGKTALVVQLAINAQLREQNVIHIALNDPVRKVCLWYDEVFKNIVAQHKVSQREQVWESILPHRFIMTFHVGGFSVPVLEERISNLTEQGIFVPRMLVIDGLPFNGENRKIVEELKSLASRNGFCVWFTMTTHRHETPDPDGFPPAFSQMVDLFDAAIQLIPDGKEIMVKPIKGGPQNFQEPMPRLNTSTLLLME